MNRFGTFIKLCLLYEKMNLEVQVTAPLPPGCFHHVMNVLCDGKPTLLVKPVLRRPEPTFRLPYPLQLHWCRMSTL